MRDRNEKRSRTSNTEKYASVMGEPEPKKEVEEVEEKEVFTETTFITPSVVTVELLKAIEKNTKDIKELLEVNFGIKSVGEEYTWSEATLALIKEEEDKNVKTSKTVRTRTK